MRIPRSWAAVLAALTLLAGVASCTGARDDDGGRDDTVRRPGVLRILASSELADMEKILDGLREDTGLTVRPTYMGTLDAVRLLESGQADGRYDALWLSSNDYLRLSPEAARKVVSETPVMTSPVALGVRPETMTELGWEPDAVTWAQVERAVRDGRLTYGMTDPARSHSGFATLISVASALSGAQSALTEGDVEKSRPRLREFFAGQRLTSGSSGWLASAYRRRDDVDALLNYESVLEGIPGLTVVRPTDGVVTADYPLTSLAASDAEARDEVARLAEALRSPQAQRSITEQTLRRPVVPSVKPAAGLDDSRRRELPFPGSRTVADGLIDSYENELRRPSRTVYVLDTSGSMRGDRLEDLKTALTGLTSDFRDREEVTLMPFGSEVKDVRTHVVDPADPDTGLRAIRRDAEALEAAGDTAVYSSLMEAYDHLGADDSAFTSIVLMTDGENTTGRAADDFDSFYRGLDVHRQRTPVFAVLFGDSDRDELTHVTELTGGRLFDARDGSLDGAFEEIRGYQ
ncbi:substrate-binding and vWA domain-containing protein [Streptomyces sp. NPDC002644]